MTPKLYQLNATLFGIRTCNQGNSPHRRAGNPQQSQPGCASSQNKAHRAHEVGSLAAV